MLQALRIEKFANTKRLKKIEEDLRTCPLDYFGKTHWKRKVKRERLITEKMQLQDRQNYIRKALSGLNR